MKKLVLPFLLFTCFCSFAGNSFYEPKLSAKAKSVLGGRLLVKLPTKNVKVINAFSNRKVWIAKRVIVYQIGKKKLILTFKELMAFRADNFVGQLGKLVKNGHSTIGVKYKISPLDRYRFLAEPSRYTIKKGKALIRTLFFVNKDNTVQSIEVHANSAALRDAKDLTKLSMKILNSVKAGKRKIRIKAKSALLESKDKSYSLRIYLPKRYIMMMTEDSKQRTYIIQRLLPIGRQAHKVIISFSPQKPKSSYALNVENSSKEHGYLLGQSVIWSKTGKKSRFNGLSLQSFLGLQKVYGRNINRRLYVQVTIQSDSNKNLNRLKKLASAIKQSKSSKNRYAFIGRDGRFNNTLARNDNRYDNSNLSTRNRTFIIERDKPKNNNSVSTAKSRSTRDIVKKAKPYKSPTANLSFADRLALLFSSSPKKDTKPKNKPIEKPKAKKYAFRYPPNDAEILLKSKPKKKKYQDKDEESRRETYSNSDHKGKQYAKNKTPNELAEKTPEPNNEESRIESETHDEYSKDRPIERKVFRYRRLPDVDEDGHHDSREEERRNRYNADEDQHNQRDYDYRYEEDEDDPYYSNDSDYDSTYYGR